MSKILVIIVSYNFEPWLEKCLNSLLTSTVSSDIIVIDNNSSDRTVDIIKEKYPTVQLIANTTNLGFGAANNIGLQMCVEQEYEYAFLVNQDTWIDPYCIEHLLQVQGDNFGVISPIHWDGTGQNLDNGFEKYISKSEKTDLNYQYASFINAAFWLIPSATIKKVGLFSPIFYHYGEDVDYGNRIAFWNLKFIFVPKALAFHDRQNRLITDSQFFKSEYVYFLTEYCNINYNFVTAFLYSVMASLKKSFKSLQKGNIKSTKNYVKIAYLVFKKSSFVIQTRKYNKTTN